MKAEPYSAVDQRCGPSGQVLRGSEQRTLPVKLPPITSSSPLLTPSIEAENVHRVYDAIAEHWNHTRYKAWPRVDAFIRALPPWSLVADLGCGNGKNIPAVHEARGFAVASDRSAPLAYIAAKSHRAASVVADCLCTPFRSCIFDAVLSIAVLHHLSTEPRRVQALREAARLLRPHGKLLVYCWSYEQDAERSRSRHRFTAQDVLVPWNFRTPAMKKSKRQDLPSNGCETPGLVQKPGSAEGVAMSTRGNGAADAQLGQVLEVYQRYCHVYREGELLQLFAQVQELEVVDHYFDTGNWCAIARRRPTWLLLT